MTKIIKMIHAAYHNHDREFTETNFVDPVTLRYRVKAVQKYLKPGDIYELPDELADELLRAPPKECSARPTAILASDDEVILWRKFNPEVAS